MNILHITPVHYPTTYWGGPTFSVYHLNNALAQIPGVKIKVLTTNSAGPKVSDRLSAEEMRTPFPYEVFFSRRLAGNSVSVGLLKQILHWIRWADVVHLTATFSFPTIPTLLLCRLYSKPVVWSLRGALLDDQNRHEFDSQGRTKHWLKAAWTGICLSLITPRRVALHVTTEQEQKSVVKLYPRAHYAVVPNGVEGPEAPPIRANNLSGGGLRLMFIGRLAPKKGIENLLHAMTQVDTSVSLDLYGTATVGQGGKNYGKGLVKLAKELGLLDKVVSFHGQVNGEAKMQAFMDADVCVIPSYSENFCIVVAEALAMGLPVIVSDRLSWGDVAKRECGLVVRNDPDSLAQAIEKMRTLELDDMGKRGWDWMKGEYEWDAIAGKMHGVYRNLLKGGGHVD